MLIFMFVWLYVTLIFKFLSHSKLTVELISIYKLKIRYLILTRHFYKNKFYLFLQFRKTINTTFFDHF